MQVEFVVAIAIFAALAAVFSILGYLRGPGPGANEPNSDQLTQLLRGESDRIRQAGDDQARELRAELANNLTRFQDANLAFFGELRRGIELRVTNFCDTVEKGMHAADVRGSAVATKLDEGLAQIVREAAANRDALGQTVDKKLDDSTEQQMLTARNLREEIFGSFGKLGENVTHALLTLTQNQERSQEALKQTVEARLDAIRTENTIKLDEMRRTVDEKLQTTLEARLGESFDRVVEQLERVHKGIGEMQTLAAGVGDLKRVLSNVRIRGTFGEVQLAMLLEQFLSSEQYVKNAQIKEGSQERVEFAIRLPGREGQSEVLLPVDAKFPHEDYARLVAASEAGDAEEVARATKDLENRIKQCAKTIRDKYILTPRTTDFGILFLPTESLFAEVLRRPGFFEQLQVEYHVTLAGPTTLTALLNALQMGFRSLAIEQRSSEVWRILGAVKTEFGKYNDVVDGLSRQLSTAARSVESLGVRTRAMSKKLRDVEKLPEETAQIILGPELAEPEDIDEELAVVTDPSGPKQSGMDA